jgi:hypothetical protein
VAKIFVAEGQTDTEVAQQLLGLAGDDPAERAKIKVAPGEGERGAFEVPDDIADAYLAERDKPRSRGRAANKPASGEAGTGKTDSTGKTES